MSSDQNSSASPFLALTATPRCAHSLQFGSPLCGLSTLRGNTVSPPSSTSLRYISTVAILCPPLLSSVLNLSLNASRCGSYFWPTSYLSTCMPSPFSQGTLVHSAMRRSISSMMSSSCLSKNMPSDVRMLLGTDCPVLLSTTVDFSSLGLARSLM